MVVGSGANARAKEMAIRKRIANIYNKREEDFPSLRKYNDYLEEVEDMTSNLVEGIDVVAIEAKIAKYQEENAEQIVNSRARKAEDLAAALRASQYVGQADPADVGAGPSTQAVNLANHQGAGPSTQAVSLANHQGAGPSTQAVSLANQGQYAPAAVPGGLMQPRPTGMAPQPIPVGAPSGPMQGHAAEDEDMKLQAERAARAGGWTIELSKRRAIEEAYSSLWI